MFYLSFVRNNTKNIHHVVQRNLSNAVASAEFDIPVAFKGHRIDPPPQHTTATREELLEYHRDMYKMRRMEITNDNEYKARAIRGFCHLYDGQEAIAVGVQAALSAEDDWITTYRCHGAALMRGASLEQIFQEL